MLDTCGSGIAAWLPAGFLLCCQAGWLKFIRPWDHMCVLLCARPVGGDGSTGHLHASCMLQTVNGVLLPTCRQPEHWWQCLDCCIMPQIVGVWGGVGCNALEHVQPLKLRRTKTPFSNALLETLTWQTLGHSQFKHELQSMHE